MGLQPLQTKLLDLQELSALPLSDPGTARLAYSGAALVASLNGAAYGAVGNPGTVVLSPGVTGTDDAIALNAAILACAAAGGGAIILLPGVYHWKSAVLNNAGNGVQILGSGRRATRVLIDDSGGNIGDGITFKNTNGCRLSDMSIGAVSPRTSGASVLSQGGDSTQKISPIYDFGANGLVIERVDLKDCFDGFVVRDTNTPAVIGNWLYYLHDCRVDTPNGGDGFQLDSTNGASHFVQQLFVYNSSGVTATVGAGINVKASGDFNFAACETFATYYGLYIVPGALRSINAGRFTRCFFDSAAQYSGFINGQGATSINDLSFKGCWFASCSHDGMNISNVTSLRFTDSIFTNNAGWGAQLFNVQRVLFSDCEFSANNASIANTGGIVATSCSHFQIRGGFSVSTSGLFTHTQANGIYINTGCDYYIVQGIDCHDNTTPFTDASTGAHRIATAGTDFLV